MSQSLGLTLPQGSLLLCRIERAASCWHKHHLIDLQEAQLASVTLFVVDCLKRPSCVPCVAFNFVMPMSDPNEFWLYDLKVEVIGTEKPMVCDHQPGQYFLMHGENLLFGPDGKFPLYPLAALLPLLPAKQRATSEHDWMTTDAYIACPDPHCGGLFRITRTGKRRFTHAETTGMPDKRGTPYWATPTSDD